MMKDAVITLDVAALYGASTLAGSGNGQCFFARLLDASKNASLGSLVVLDLKKVEIVSASFFRAAFRAYRDYARSSGGLYVIFANANPVTIEEVRFFAETTGDAFVFAKLGRHSDIKGAFVVGKLDEKQARALSALLELRQADAGELFHRFPESGVSGAAAWSNRLAALALKGLVVERLEGRVKKYRPIVEDLAYGS